MLFTYFWVSYNTVKLQICSSWHSWAIAIFRFSLLNKSVVTWNIAFTVFCWNMFSTYFLHLNSELRTLLLNTIWRASFLCPFILSFLLWNSNHTVSWHRALSQALIACLLFHVSTFVNLYPTALIIIVFIHCVRMGGQAVGKSLCGMYLRNHKV